MKNLEIKTAIQVQKPVGTVFEAIVNPEEMSNYFISKSSGRMETGEELMWKFPEFDMEFPVRVKQAEKDKFISFGWDSEDGRELLVEITLEPKENDSTLVSVTEKGMPADEAGIKWLAGNTEGWANFLACLKAWVEYKINLRKGAFDYRR